jgi:DNA-binding transcriptional LysR family regulator
MELRHLRYFVAAAEHKGFREASRVLHVSQPAISKSLKQLEQELGTKLFCARGAHGTADAARRNLLPGDAAHARTV